MTTKTVLLVDDSAFMRATLRDIFTKEGYQVVGEAESGEGGVEKYMQLRPSLVTMDVMMPGGDGINAVKKIIAQDPDAKLLMVSGSGQQAPIIEALKAGAKGFIVKPFKPENVIAEARRVLGQ